MADLLPPQPLVTTLQLGALLKSARRDRKRTQADVAGRIGVSQSRVSHLEQHADEISVAQLLRWCAALGIELQLKLREDPPAPAERPEW